MDDSHGGPGTDAIKPQRIAAFYGERTDANIPLSAPYHRVSPPYNIEAEQALLGAILIDNSAMVAVEGLIDASAFFDPFHTEVFKVIKNTLAESRPATPVTLSPHFENSPGVRSRTAKQYLGFLARNATTTQNVRDYAKIVVDMAERRRLIVLGEDLAARAAAVDVPLADAARMTRETLQNFPGPTRHVQVLLQSASTIKPRPISWLWPGCLALGKVHMLAGRPGAGKTTLAIAIAATVTTGGTWPDDTQCKPGCVVIWSGEDDPADTLVPRLIVAGADLDRVHFVQGTIEGGEPASFDPAKHLSALTERIASLGNVALLIVDPVVSAVPGDSHKNAEVRRALQPLSDLASTSACAVLGITHFTKGTSGRDPVERLTGSLAFGAVARIVLVAAKVEDAGEDGDGQSKEGRHVVMRAKSNISPDGGGFEYELQQRPLPNGSGIVTSAVKWGRVVLGSARELLAEAESTAGEAGDSVSDAIAWLRDVLAEGALETPTIKNNAKGAGHSWASVQRAKKKLGIKPKKKGMAGGWVWELPRRSSPNPEGAHPNTMGTFDVHEHLRSEGNADCDKENPA